MAYKIVWTEEARSAYRQTIEYLETYFSDKEIIRFTKHTLRKIAFIESNPRTYRRSQKANNIHYTNILRRVLLVYRVMPHKKVVQIILFWDGRRNPKKFKY